MKLKDPYQQTYFYLIDDGKGDKKAKGKNKCIIKRRLKFEDYKKCLQNNKVILRSQQTFKSEANNLLTEKINKNSLSFSDYKILRSFNKVKSYPYGTNVGKVCK